MFTGCSHGRGEAAWHPGPEGDWRPSWSTWPAGTRSWRRGSSVARKSAVHRAGGSSLTGTGLAPWPWGRLAAVMQYLFCAFSNWGLITPIAGPCYTQRKARWHFHNWRQLGLEQRTRLVRSPAVLFSYLLSYPFYFHKANVHKRFLSYPFSYLFSCPFS
jgi:hypothetical protein